MEDSGIKFEMIVSKVLPSGMVMLISPPTYEEISRAGGDMAKAIIEHNKVMVMNHLRSGSAD